MNDANPKDAARAGDVGGATAGVAGGAKKSGELGVPGSAVASVVLGIAGVLTSFAVLPGLVCGAGAAWLAHRASGQTGVDSGRPGRGYAIAGRATGGAALILSALVGGVFVLGSVVDQGGRHGHPNTTQLRGVHQGLVTFANSNKEHFPGLDSKGNILHDSHENTGLSGDGDTVEARFWIMLEGNFFTPEYVLSPSENDPLVTEYIPGTGQHANPVLWDNNTRHFSYAMLSIDGSPGQRPDAKGRDEEWQQSLNTQAIVVSDRNTGSNATASVQSIHTQTRGDWKGRVLWNDNHVGFEHTHILETHYATGTPYGGGPPYTGHHYIDAQGNGTDNLFERQGDDDAYMIHQGD